MHKVFTKHNLLYPVPITEESEKPLKGFPWIHPGDFLRTMAVYNDLSHILGGFPSVAEAEDLLVTFWTRYRTVYPNFELFEELDAGTREMRKCVPLYLHGDEGVTYKRRGVLIMSFQSPLGFGTSKRPQEMSLNLQNMGEAGLPLNFLKCGMYTRMLMVCCPKDCMGFVYGKNDFIIGKQAMHHSTRKWLSKLKVHVLPCQDMCKDDPRVWNAIMNKVASAFQGLERDGIELDGQGRIYPIILGNKGDWSYLAT